MSADSSLLHTIAENQIVIMEALSAVGDSVLHPNTAPLWRDQLRARINDTHTALKRHAVSWGMKK